MTENSLEQTHLAFDGPFDFPTGATVFVGLLFVFFCLLWRERKVTGNGMALTFFCLRAVALAVVFWMLLAATSVTVDRSDIQRAVIIAVDMSPSMSTIDTDNSFDDLRWTLAEEDQSDESAVVACDRALVAATFARCKLSEVIGDQGKYRPPADVLELLVRCSSGLARVVSHCEAASKQVDRSSSRSTIDEVLERLEAASQELRPVVERWNGTLDVTQLDRLAETAAIVSGIEHQLKRVAADLLSENEADGDPRIHGGQRNLTRMGRVAAVADRLYEQMLAKPTHRMNLKRVLFDNRTILLSESDRFLGSAKSPERLTPQLSNEDETAIVGTDLGAALSELRGKDVDSVAAVVMFTDAAHNQPDSRDPWNVAADSPDVPIYVVPIGSTRRLRDMVLYSLVAPPVVMEGDDVVIEAHVRAHGCAGESAVVELLRDGEIVDFKNIDFHADPTSRRVTFSTELAEHGTFEFEVRAGGIAEEQSRANNAQSITVDVTRRDIRVLLADGMARWEYKYLRELFRRDETVDCDELVFAPRVLGTGFREGDSALPITVDGWAQYDVAILGDIPAAHFPDAAQRSLEEFISKREGTIVIVAGDRYMPRAYLDAPLLELMPTERQSLGQEPEDGYRLSLTSAGLRHHALTIADDRTDSAQTWESVSRNVPIYSLSEYSRPKPSAETLIQAVSTVDAVPMESGPIKAFLCWQPVGRGRVIYLASPDTWRLRFRRGDTLHHRFWGQLLRWAISRELNTGSELLQIRVDRSHYDLNESIEVSVNVADEAGEPVVGGAIFVTAERSGEIVQSIELAPDEEIPGRYGGQFDGLDAGEYTLTPTGNAVDELRDALATGIPVSAGIPSTQITVRPMHHTELLATQCRLDVAQRIADASGGQIIPPTAVAEVLALTDLKPTVNETKTLKPIWPQWRYFWIVFACLSTEWGMRKWKGLP